MQTVKILSFPPLNHFYLDGRAGADVNSNNTNVKKKRSSLQKKSPLSFFSHKIGIGEGLGLQEYMVYVSDGGEDDLEVWGYKENMTRLLLTLFLVVMTGVLPLGLFLYWMEHYWLFCTQEPCVLEEATTVLVVVRRFCTFIYPFISFSTGPLSRSAHHQVRQEGLQRGSLHRRHGHPRH